MKYCFFKLILLVFLTACSPYFHIVYGQCIDSTVTTLTGIGSAGFIDGSLNEARFNRPSGIAVDRLGNIYVSDRNNHSIRLITPEGIVSTIAGTGSSGYVDGNGSIALKLNCSNE